MDPRDEAMDWMSLPPSEADVAWADPDAACGSVWA